METTSFLFYFIIPEQKNQINDKKTQQNHDFYEFSNFLNF